MWLEIHTRLQEICMELFDTAEDCKSLVAEAEIDSSRISFNEPNAFRWQNIIWECSKQRSLDRLTPVLLDRYSNNPILQRAVQPWIRGNPEEKGAKVPKPAKAVIASPPEVLPATITVPVSKEGVIELESPATIVVSNPTGGEVGNAEKAPDLVAVMVPKEMADDAQLILVATVNSLRRTIKEHEKSIEELKQWRFELSRLSRADVAVKTGGNEQETFQ